VGKIRTAVAAWIHRNIYADAETSAMLSRIDEEITATEDLLRGGPRR
jgi:hypothetical protein